MTTKIVIIKCAQCGKKKHIKVNYQNYLEWEKNDRRKTYEIFTEPYLTPGELYCLHTGFCSYLCEQEYWKWG